MKGWEREAVTLVKEIAVQATTMLIDIKHFIFAWHPFLHFFGMGYKCCVAISKVSFQSLTVLSSKFM